MPKVTNKSIRKQKREKIAYFLRAKYNKNKPPIAQIQNLLARWGFNELYILPYSSITAGFSGKYLPSLWGLIGIVHAINENPLDLLKIYFEELHQPLTKYIEKLEYFHENYKKEFPENIWSAFKFVLEYPLLFLPREEVLFLKETAEKKDKADEIIEIIATSGLIQDTAQIYKLKEEIKKKLRS